MGQVRWSEQATSCLEEIHTYIAHHNPDAAQRVALGIWERVQTLESFPRLGHEHHTRGGRNVHVLLYGHYSIVYRLLAEDVVEIVGVFHTAMDLDAQLDSPS